MNIDLEDTVIYGTSAGGFLSIIMGIYLKGAKIVADNTQLDVSNWAFTKHNYVPKIYLHVNLCSKVANSMQLAPFLEKIEKIINVTEYNNIEVILHYEEKKGHDDLSQDEAIKFLYEVLER